MELAKNFSDKSYTKIEAMKFSMELERRILDLKLRNSIILARDEHNDNIIGAGSLSVFIDFIGNTHAILHQVITHADYAFKKGIEEEIIREILKYIKNSLKIENAGFLLLENHPHKSQYLSLLMKLGFKKSNFSFYEVKL